MIMCRPSARQHTASRSACLDGKFHVATNNYKGIFIPKPLLGQSPSLIWRLLETFLSIYCYCVIENVLYSVNDCTFRWYETEVNMWREV
ncbi:unnamed protein product [Brassica rapa subsp. narinosa]